MLLNIQATAAGRRRLVVMMMEKMALATGPILSSTSSIIGCATSSKPTQSQTLSSFATTNANTHHSAVFDPSDSGDSTTVVAEPLLLNFRRHSPGIVVVVNGKFKRQTQNVGISSGATTTTSKPFCTGNVRMVRDFFDIKFDW